MNKRPNIPLPWFWLLFLITGLACQLTDETIEGGETAVAATEIVHLPTTTPLPSTPTSAPLTPFVTAIPTATETPTPIPTVTAIPTASQTPIPWMHRSSIGTSVQGRPIEVVRLGTGPKWFVVLAAMHGGHECNTNELAEGMITRLTADQTLLPENVTLFVVPLVNPDGCALNIRYNANRVDLNRNWATSNWTADAAGPGGVIVGSGGPIPFSELETVLLQGWLLELWTQSPDGDLRVISYHSVVSTGLAQPAYAIYGQPEPRSEALARQYAEVTGYLYSAVWVGTYTITGEFIHWAGENDIIAFDVELPDRNTADSIPNGWSETHIETNLRGLLTIMQPALLLS